MKEPINVKINLMVTPSIWEFLDKVENKSEYIRNLIEKDIQFVKKHSKNKKLNL